MINPCRILRSIAGLLVLSLAVSGCHRTSYVFEPGSSEPRVAEHASRLADSAALSAAAAVAQEPQLLVTRHNPSFAKKNWFHHSRTQAVATRMPPFSRPAMHLNKVLAAKAARQDGPIPPERYRSRGIALLLALVPFFYGILGLHRFYLGYAGHGIAYLLGGLLAAFLVLLGAIGLIFSSTSFTAVFVVGIIIAVVLYGLQISDIIHIITGSLKPKNGEYNPRFFQTKPSAKAPDPTLEQK